MEIQFPNQEKVVQAQAAAVIPSLHSVRQSLAKFAAPGIDAILEDHGLSLCLHWQSVSPEYRVQIYHEISKLRDTQPNLRFHVLPTSYDIVPAFDWTKGRALESIQADLEQIGSKPGGYAFFGDSQADEPALSWVNGKGGTSPGWH